jgi:hypothetical protein
MSHANQNGLEWVEGTFGLEPRWKKEPEISTVSQIASRHLKLQHDTVLEVTFHSKGAFTKVYRILTPSASYLMRISLPIDPRHRTESAVATSKFLGQKTSLPMPQVIAYSSDDSNELGFEWMLTTDTDGTTLYKAWRKMSWDSKEAMIKQLAQYQAQMLDNKLQKIGHLYYDASEFEVNQLVTAIHYQGDRIMQNDARGPFNSSFEWLQARLQSVLANQQRILDTSCDEDEIEDAEFALDLAKQLSDILPTIFLPSSGAVESTVLVTSNLTMRNIIIGADGRLATILDWECVPVLPLWRACRLPQFLEERLREERPLKEEYDTDSDEEDDKDDDGLDNEGITDLYWEHLLEFELTQLSKVFHGEMEKRSPEWAALATKSSLKNSFERAVEECDNGWRNKCVKQWVDSLLGGEPQSLTSMIFSYPDLDAASQTDMDWEET